MCEKKKAGGVLFRRGGSHISPAQPSPAQRSAAAALGSPREAPSCSQQDGPAWGPRRLVPCANPRIHVRKSAAWALADQ